jgi:ABC-type Fe3+-siderophore transport system permease subunit
MPFALGVGVIVGHLVARAFRKGDRYKVPDILMMCIGLLLILARGYRLFVE